MDKLEIVHRDIKPENILVSTNEQGKFRIGEDKKNRVELLDIKLADFGYAIRL
jgi:serine/threonine protein kinase